MILNQTQQEIFEYDFLSKFDIKKRESSSGEIRAVCPSCGHDKLYINIGTSKDNNPIVMLHCKHGCDYKEIIQAAAIEPRTLYLKRKNLTLQETADYREHVYTNESGEILAKKCIYKFFACYVTNKGKNYYPKDKMTFWKLYDSSRQAFSDKSGLNGLKMPLYRLDKLNNTDTVYIVEGEKDVETLERMGYTATTSPNGAGANWKKEYNKYLYGKYCIVLADNDEAGEKAGIKTTESLTSSGISCKLIKTADIYPEISQKGDITDIFDTVGLEKTVDLLRNAIEKTIDYVPMQKENQERQEKEQPNSRPYWILETNKGEKISSELLADYIQNTEKYFLVQQKDQETQRFFWYDNGVYTRISPKLVKAKIRDIITPFGKTLAKVRAIEDTYTLLTYPEKQHYIADDSLLDANENIINFQNGVLHLDTMELKKHSPEYISTIQIPCNWNPIEKPAPNFWKYITHLANDDNDTIKTLLEVIGFVLSNIKIERFKQALFLVGQGNSGKSKFLEFMQMLIGAENYCAMPFEKLDKRFSASTLYKKRLAADDDCNYCSFSNISTFKQITGGGPLQNEEKGKQAFTFIYNGLYIICANNLPLFGGDKGIHVYDRILPIQCGNSIPRQEQDKNLLEKLYSEREAIIFAAVISLQNAIKNNYNFSVSAASSQLITEYMKENDIVLQFIDECCIKRTGKDNVSTKVLYTAFRTWCEQNGEKYIPKKSEFTESICRYYGIEPKDKKKILKVYDGLRCYDLTLTADAKKELHACYDSV